MRTPSRKAQEDRLCGQLEGVSGKVRLTIAGSSRDVDVHKNSIHGL